VNGELQADWHKVEIHAARVLPNYSAHGFIRIHRGLRTSPAMAAGLTD
jgi:hypothetical protein